MNFSSWCKHFRFVYLLISALLLSSFALTTGDEPTEEPEEGNIANKDSSSANTKTNGSHNGGKEARALFHSSGDTWRTASKLLQRGVRMFRDSLHEGVKVAHMFKEDLDEGVSSIMRQNRGVKIEGQNKPDNANEPPGLFDSQMLREGVLGGILRFMGINSKQMGVIALNVLIIVAEWITSAMMGSSDSTGATSRMIKSSLLEWASTGYNSQLEKLLAQAKSHSLPEKLIDNLSEKTGDSTSCVQLLLCKMSPVIWGVQDTVKTQLDEPEELRWKIIRAASTHANTTKSGNSQSEPRGFIATSQFLLDKFLGHLPPKERLLDFGDRCEKKFPHCQLLNFKSG